MRFTRALRQAAVQVNGRQYLTDRATRPVVGICIDGSEEIYMEEAMSSGLMPNLKRMLGKGTQLSAKANVPTFTNPNNMSIVTGRPPNVHGICGNFFFDRESGEEVMMNSPEFLRAPTIFSALCESGFPVVTITAKDKLLKLLSHGIKDSSKFLSFSAEMGKPTTTFLSEHLDFLEQPRPGIYDPELSVYCVKAGANLLERWQAANPQATKQMVMYLSTTDFVQHKYRPGDKVADEFYHAMDKQLGRLDDLGAIIGITADHGMNDKCTEAGEPNVVYLQDEVDKKGLEILPITDPYVVHHGALGGYATVYVPESDVSSCKACIEALPGVEKVLLRQEAAELFSLPPDRIGELVVLGDHSTSLGRKMADHDLSEVHKLRSHGSLHEQRVPLLFNTAISSGYEAMPRNHDLYHMLFNLAEF